MLACTERIVCYRKGMETDAQAGLERECQWDWYQVANGNGSGVERKGGGEWKWVGKPSGGKYYLYTLSAQPLAPSPLAQKGIRREK